VKHRNYVDIIPAFIKAVNFADPKQVRLCYEFLDHSDKAKNMQPEEALALLGYQFGDEKVRIFALEKISKLDDHMLSLYIP
jgi:Phosphoinositide 3-kinase family, accessory domain (PIK domain)